MDLPKTDKQLNDLSKKEFMSWTYGPNADRYAKMMLSAIIALSAVGLFFGVRSRAEPVDGYQASWQLVRETATEDGADFDAVYDLAAAEGDFASKDSSAVSAGGPFRLKSQRSDLGQYLTVGTKWQFIIAGGAADDDTFSVDIIGWSRDNGPQQKIAEGNGVIGTQDVVLYPDDGATATNVWWADTIAFDATTKWTTAAGGQNGISVLNSGNNQIAVIELHTQGIEWIQFVFYDALASQAGEADPVTVFGRRVE